MSEPDPNPAAVPEVPQDVELYISLLEQLEDGIYMVDRSRRIRYWNAGAQKITGYHPHEVMGRLCEGDLLMHRDSEGVLLCGRLCPLAGVMRDGRPHECDVFLRHKHGHCLPVRVRSRAIRGRDGEIAGAVEVFEEAIAPGRAAIRALEPFGCLDPATGVPSRQYGEMKVAQRLEEWCAFGIPIGWLQVEVDELERLEHRYGHGVVDAAMTLVANTIDRNAGSFDVLARWDRTSFRVAVYNCSLSGLTELARKLVMLVRSSNLEWWGDPLGVTVSVGGAMAEHGDAFDTLEARAAAACSGSRAEGGNRATLARPGAYHSHPSNPSPAG